MTAHSLNQHIYVYDQDTRRPTNDHKIKYTNDSGAQKYTLQIHSLPYNDKSCGETDDKDENYYSSCGRYC